MIRKNYGYIEYKDKFENINTLDSILDKFNNNNDDIKDRIMTKIRRLSNESDDSDSNLTVDISSNNSNISHSLTPTSVDSPNPLNLTRISYGMPTAAVRKIDEEISVNSSNKGEKFNKIINSGNRQRRNSSIVSTDSRDDSLNYSPILSPNSTHPANNTPNHTKHYRDSQYSLINGVTITNHISLNFKEEVENRIKDKIEVVNSNHPSFKIKTRKMSNLSKGSFLLSSGPSKRNQNQIHNHNVPPSNDVPRFSPDSTPSKPIDRSKEAARLASMLMNLRFADENSKIDYHYPESPLRSPRYELTDENNNIERSPSPTSSITISPTTKARAVRARAKLELQYELISEYQSGRRRITARKGEMEDNEGDNRADRRSNDINEDEEEEEDDEDECEENNESPLGVLIKEKTTYNPLQVIRNRNAKKLQGQGYLNYMANKSWNFIWNIDVSELVSDFAWRARYDYMMRDNKGRLLYPEKAHEHDYEHHRERERGGEREVDHEREHDRDRGDRDHDDLLRRLKSKLSRPNSAVNSNENSDSSWSKSDLSDLDDNRAHRREKHSDSSSRRNSESPTRKVPFESINAKGRYDRTVDTQESPSPEKKLTASRGAITRVSSVAVAGTSTSASSPDSSFNTNTSNSVAVSAGVEEDAKKSSPTTSSSSLPNPDDKISYYSNELKYLDMVYELSYLQISRKPYWYVEHLNHDTAENMSTEMMKLSKEVESNLIPNERVYLATTEQDMRKLQFDLTQDHGNRLDSVLLDSDRILNEVNTSLSLEIRKVGVRLDKLEADSPTLQWLWKLGYILLEWGLVSLMWIVWGVVFFLAKIKGGFLRLNRMIMWFFWC